MKSTLVGCLYYRQQLTLLYNSSRFIVAMNILLLLVAVAEICGKPLDLRRRLRTTTSTTSAGPALTLSSSASTIYTTPALIVEFLHPHPPTATHPPIMPAVQGLFVLSRWVELNRVKKVLMNKLDKHELA